MKILSPHDAREALALIWALSPADRSVIEGMLQTVQDSEAVTSSDCAHGMFWHWLYQRNLAELRPSPLGGMENPGHPEEYWKHLKESMRAYMLSPAGRELLPPVLRHADTGYPSKDALVTPLCLAMLGDYIQKKQSAGIAGNKLGVLYAQGFGVPKDQSKALQYWTAAASQGDALANNNLGLCYLKGAGVRQDFMKAVEYFKAAAEAGSKSAYDNLGELAMAGKGMPRDEAYAFECFQKSAASGYPNAAVKLVKLCHHGIGTPQSNADAYYWILIAEKFGVRFTEVKQQIAAAIPPEKMAEVTRAASEWVPVPLVRKA